MSETQQLSPVSADSALDVLTQIDQADSAIEKALFASLGTEAEPVAGPALSECLRLLAQVHSHTRVLRIRAQASPTESG